MFFEAPLHGYVKLQATLQSPITLPMEQSTRRRGGRRTAPDSDDDLVFEAG